MERQELNRINLAKLDRDMINRLIFAYRRLATYCALREYVKESDWYRMRSRVISNYLEAIK